MKKLIILRGPSGCGKSYLASQLRHIYDECQVLSADSFMYEGNEYKFDPKKLGPAHAKCQCDCVFFMSRNTPVIVIDNTNTQKWEYAIYLELAKVFNYEVEVKIPIEWDPKVCAARNVHGVPESKILEMIARFEL